jgi:predicted ATP-dependent protease
MGERDYVSSVTENRIFDEIATGEMIIALDGYKTGVVNGLAVLDRGPSSFGTPTVISATVAPGTEGIVNIEHEAGLSGEIHDKGLLILEGYLRKRYARNFPLSIYSGICFEQSYAEIDGDSASSSELYALLSAIGDIPIKQNIAVTGSVNQMGELQPVGGINEKITGFYNVCKRLGLKNHPGVIIPVQNIKSLILPYEIIDAIGKREFHIYPVQTIDEGMQVLTDRPAGVRNQKGNFPMDTLNRTIEDRLKDLFEISRPQN